MTPHLLAQTAIPRRTVGWRLIDEPRREPAHAGAWRPEGVGRRETKPVQGAPEVAAPADEGGEHEGRERLRAAVMDRLRRDMLDVMGRLEQFLMNAGRAGVVNLSLVLSESFVTQELWREPRGSPEHRARLIHALGLPRETDTALLLRTLVREVRRAFADFRASPQGVESQRQYDDLLRRYELAQVVLVVAGHDSGPMGGELFKFGVTADKDFTRSLLLDARVLAVGPGAAVGSQILVAGLSAPQLAMVVAQLRQLNPRITNHQVRRVLTTVLDEVKSEAPRTLGRAQVERMQQLARQLLRFKALEYLWA